MNIKSFLMSREYHIKRYFTDIQLSFEYPDIYYVRKSILHFIQACSSTFHGSLLDVGCGIMPYRELLLAKNKNIISYIGLDFENALDDEYALGKPDLFWKGDVIPMQDNSVETVLATELFEHCSNPENVMREILRVLKPGGILCFTVPFIWNLHLVPYDEYRYTPFSLKRHLTSVGFTNIELTSLGSWDASLAQMIGIWLQQRPMKLALKKLLFFFLSPIMKKLINRDAKANKKLFADGIMMTGLGGLATK